MFANLHNLSHHAAWRRQLELILESTGEGIYGIDLRGRCIFINEAGAAMLGYTPDEVLGRSMHYLIHHSLALDLKILLLTAIKVVRRDGVSH